MADVVDIMDMLLEVVVQDVVQLKDVDQHLVGLHQEEHLQKWEGRKVGVQLHGIPGIQEAAGLLGVELQGEVDLQYEVALKDEVQLADEWDVATVVVDLRHQMDTKDVVDD